MAIKRRKIAGDSYRSTEPNISQEGNSREIQLKVNSDVLVRLFYSSKDLADELKTTRRLAVQRKSPDLVLINNLDPLLEISEQIHNAIKSIAAKRPGGKW